MPVCMFVRGVHARVSGTDARTVNPREFNSESLDVKQIKLIGQSLTIDSRRHHGAENHVAAGARETIEIESLHDSLAVR